MDKTDKLCIPIIPKLLTDIATSGHESMFEFTSKWFANTELYRVLDIKNNAEGKELEVNVISKLICIQLKGNIIIRIVYLL